MVNLHHNAGISSVLAAFIVFTSASADESAVGEHAQDARTPGLQGGELGGTRTWTDRTGKHKTVAAFVSLDQTNQKVKLKLNDGSTRSVRLDALSIEDRCAALLAHLPQAQRETARRAIQSGMAYFIWTDDSPKPLPERKPRAEPTRSIPFHFFALKAPERAGLRLQVISSNGSQDIESIGKGFFKDLQFTEKVTPPGGDKSIVVELINSQLAICGTARAHFIVLELRGEIHTQLQGDIQLHIMSNDRNFSVCSNSVAFMPSQWP